MNLSIIIPVYNEEKRIVKTLQSVETFLCQHKARWQNAEVIVVSDGSQDNTENAVKHLMTKFKELKFIGYPINKGKGYAVRTGVAASMGRIVIFMDADGATPITELNKLSDIMVNNKADIVIGSRRMPETNIMKKQPIHRIFIGHVFSYITRLILQVPFLDTQCGFKVFNGNIGRELFGKCNSDGFAFDVEILYMAIQSGVRVVEHGVDWNDDADSRVSPLQDGFKMLKCIIRLKKYMRKETRCNSQQCNLKKMQ